MAARFVVAVALFALAYSSPLQSGHYTNSQGIATGAGENIATANVHGNVASATGSNKNNAYGLARDGLGFYGPGQAIANVQTGDAPVVELGRTQGYYHPLPAAAPAVLTYNHNYAYPRSELVYGAPGIAQSQANVNGAGSAISNAQTGNGIASSNAKTSGYGYGSAISKAHTNGIAQLAPIAELAPIANAPIAEPAPIEPSVIVAKNQGYNAIYTPIGLGSASSNANVNGYGSAMSSAQAAKRRSISWRFGTAYDNPAGYGSVKAATPIVYQAAAAPVVYQPAIATPIAYEAAPVAATYGPGNVRASSDTHGQSAAHSTAANTAGHGSAKSTVTSAGGAARSDADVNNGAYNSLYRSGSALGTRVGHTNAAIQGFGSAGSYADLINDSAISKSSANTFGQGSANSDSIVSNNGLYNAYYRSGEAAQLGWKTGVTNARTAGDGTADATAQGLLHGNQADSFAKSFGYGSASSKSQSY